MSVTDIPCFMCTAPMDFDADVCPHCGAVEGGTPKDRRDRREREFDDHPPKRRR